MQKHTLIFTNSSVSWGTFDSVQEALNWKKKYWPNDRAMVIEHNDKNVFPQYVEDLFEQAAEGGMLEPH